MQNYIEIFVLDFNLQWFKPPLRNCFVRGIQSQVVDSCWSLQSWRERPFHGIGDLLVTRQASPTFLVD